MSVPKGLYVGDVWHPVNKHVTEPSPNVAAARTDFEAVARRLAEALVVSPSVTIRLDGANVVAPLLAQRFTPRVLEELLDEGALRFVLFSGAIVQFVDPSSFPIMLGAIARQPIPALNDIEFATKDGYRAVELSLNLKRRLIRKTLSHTELTPEAAPQRAVNLTFAAINRGDVIDRGFSPDRLAEQTMNRDEATRLQGLASEIFETTVIFDRKLAVGEGDVPWARVRHALDHLKPDGDGWTTLERIYHAEAVPSVQALLEAGVITYSDILRIRRHKATEGFRDWLWRLDGSNVSDVAARYLEVMKRGLDRNDRRWFRTGRVSLLNVVSTAGGTVLGSVDGTLGAIGGFIAGAVLSTGVSLLDEFWLQEALQGPNPRRFATDVLRAYGTRVGIHDGPSRFD